MTGYCKCGHHHDRHKKMLRYVSSVLERLQPASFDSVSEEAPYAKEAFPGPCEGAVKTHEGIVTCSCNKFAPEGGQ